MSLWRLFLRDCAYYRKPFALLAAAACLVCAILTSAMLIGDSVRGTLEENVERDTAFVQTRLRFSTPIDMALPGGVLHTAGFIAPGVKTHVYAFPGAKIVGRDAYCSDALSRTLNLSIGDVFTVRLQTVAAISSEELLGRPPKLKQLQLIYRGVWNDEKRDVNFESPQLQACNLFVNHDLLTQTLELERNAINEQWLAQEDSASKLPDAAIWKLSQLYFERWGERPVLKSKAYFLPEALRQFRPDVIRGLTTFAETFSASKDSLHYFFIGAFEGDILPVKHGQAVVSAELPGEFQAPGELTFFTSDSYRKITRKTQHFAHVTKADDSAISAVLNPEVPGLTDADDCSRWEAGLPIDFDRITAGDKAYWERHHSKPKLYLNFAQAQELFCPGQCTVLIFERDADVDEIQSELIALLRQTPGLFQADQVTAVLWNNIRSGMHFAPLFLGLSMFIIVSALLVLAMLLKIHLLDRAAELRDLQTYTGQKWTGFLLTEIMLALLPGMAAGLLLGMFFCRVQLFLLERVWNEIILMNRLVFHAEPATFIIAFGVTFCSALVVVLLALPSATKTPRFLFSTSHAMRSIFALGSWSFLRRLGQYRACLVLLILGFLGTLGVGSFGIKARGEDAFGFQYVAETALPVVPTHDEPFPPDGLAIRVKDMDSADCSNLLRAETPTVYGCDLERLTGDADFLKGFSAAVDAGSMTWIMKKRIGDTIHYPHGDLTLRRTLKASVFQRGILTDSATFAHLFPEVQGAQFFLIRDRESVEAYRKLLEHYGLTLTTTDAFMARAESFQNRYLAIFLQLGTLGFILGIGSLLLLMLRNLHAERTAITLLLDSGFSKRSVFDLYLTENLCLYLTSAIISLLVLVLLAAIAHLHWPTLLLGWLGLTGLGVFLTSLTLHRYFRFKFH